jgi:exodeoxyribonuclease VII large subunit
VQKPTTATTAWTVSELNRQAKTLLESHFDILTVEGELGNFTAASSGHWYFTLKDANAQVRCAMFKRANERLSFRPSVGDQVTLRGRVSLYENRGDYQLIAEHMAPGGDGALQRAFEQLKQRLAAEGLFDTLHKQPVPQESHCVAVITSPTGAALHDIVSVMARRSPMTRIIVFPVPVQGTDAAGAIARAVADANEYQQTGRADIDVIIVGRGGGSLEDLWAFNEEIVARAIWASKLPVVSAVGHEIDTSIADFVADLRAPTPSAAAELVTTDQTEWMQRFDRMQQRLHAAMQRVIQRDQTQLRHCVQRLRNPKEQIIRQQRELSQLRQRLANGMNRQQQQHRLRWQHLQGRLSQCHPKHRLDATTRQLDDSLRRLHREINRKLEASRRALAEQCRVLNSLSPLNTLGRGYAIVSDAEGRILRDANSSATGNTINIRLDKGSLSGTVTSIKTD